jgi:hypothetical protein
VIVSRFGPQCSESGHRICQKWPLREKSGDSPGALQARVGVRYPSRFLKVVPAAHSHGHVPASSHQCVGPCRATDAVPHLAANLYLGTRLPNHDDSYPSMWRIAWIAHDLRTDPRHLFGANVFYPERPTLAYTDATLLEGARLGLREPLRSPIKSGGASSDRVNSPKFI